jgi:GntR family transcriptional regulator, transcriptional repressor for pyruvate dehydrogenase complex
MMDEKIAQQPRSERPRVRRGLGSKPPQGATTADRVASMLVDHIRRNRLRAGAPLPSEVQTSSDLRVSRGAVREAYRSLSSAGLVEIANGRSPRVGHLSNQSLLRVVQHALWTDQASAEQILELRGAIEERAAELASVHRTTADLDSLRRCVAMMKAAGSKVEAYVKADIHFHEILGRATGNPLFGLVSSALREAMGTSIRVSLAGRRSRAELGRAIETHARIVAALERRRPKEARRLMIQHYSEANAAVRRQILASAKARRAE